MAVIMVLICVQPHSGFASKSCLNASKAIVSPVVTQLDHPCNTAGAIQGRNTHGKIAYHQRGGRNLNRRCKCHCGSRNCRSYSKRNRQITQSRVEIEKFSLSTYIFRSAFLPNGAFVSCKGSKLLTFLMRPFIFIE